MPYDELRQAAIAGAKPSWADVLAAHSERFESADDTALRALLQQPPAAGRAGKLVSRNVRNVLVNWDKALKDAMRIAALPVIITSAARALHLVWLSGAAFPWAAVGSAILGLLVAWRSVTGLLDIDLSDGHAKILCLLWLNRDRNVTLEDVHAIFDAELESGTVSALLTDLSDLGLIRFGIGSIELLDEIVLTES